MLEIQKRSYSIPKLGNSHLENEDAVDFSLASGTPRKTLVLRCAVADGATQTSFSKLWAQLLVRKAVRYTPSKKRLFDILADAGPCWQAKIAELDLPWHAQEKVRKGAFASLLWASLRQPEPNAEAIHCKILAAGDSNLFVFHNGVFERSIPVNCASDFGNSPILLSSLTSRNAQINEVLRFEEFDLGAGDELVLATDAIAHYFLRQIEANLDPLQEYKEQCLRDCGNLDQFGAWIHELRNASRIKNDDTTLVWIQITETKDFIEATHADAATNGK